MVVRCLGRQRQSLGVRVFVTKRERERNWELGVERERDIGGQGFRVRGQKCQCFIEIMKLLETQIGGYGFIETKILEFSSLDIERDRGSGVYGDKLGVSGLERESDILEFNDLQREILGVRVLESMEDRKRDIDGQGLREREREIAC